MKPNSILRIAALILLLVPGPVLRAQTGAADIAVHAGPSPAAAVLATAQLPATDFGNAQVATPSTRFFAIRNVGTAALQSLAVAATGSDAASFLTGALPATLAPGATTLLRVDFVPTSAGSKSAVLQIASDDPDENPFAVNVTGTGTTLPVVSVAVDRSTVTEDGTTNLRFIFKRSSVGAALTVNFAVGGTATFATDYTVSGATAFFATAGTVTFGASTATVTVTVDPTADAPIEPEETVILSVSPAEGYAAGLTEGLTTAATGKITNDDLNPAATGLPAIFTTAAKTTAGLTGSYVNSNLRAVNEPDWRVTRPISGSRVDTPVNFGTADWGARASVGVTGGSDADWNQFSVQWDGWVEVTVPQRLALASDDGSRMWIDLDGNGSFDPSGPEYVNNLWGSGHGTATVYSDILAPGLYRIRIQYEEASGGSIARLTASNGNYMSFDGNLLSRTVWEGRNIAYLTESGSLDPGVMALLVEATDAAYDFYFAATNRKPSYSRHVNGKLTLTQVPTTCGAGCGFLGFTGIEILSPYFTEMYDAVRLRHQYNQIPFYELGRNFWYYGGQLAYKSPDNTGTVTTAFAVAMRNILMDALGFTGTPLGNRPWADNIRYVNGLTDGYARNPAHDWFTTLRVGMGVNDVSTNGSSSLFASLLQRLRSDYPRPGEAFLRDLWTTAGTYPAATTSLGAVNNFFLAACAGTQLNLTDLIETSWKFPLSTSAKSTAATLYGSSVPASPATDTLIAANAVWSYKDNGSNQGTAWKEPGFVDSAWTAGPAELGYGEGDEATVIDDSPSPTYVTPASNRYITTYFRHHFTVADPARYASLTLYLKRDDGAVVYLNGAEIVRDNIAEGPFTHTQPSVGNIGNADESIFFVYEIAASGLVAGTNVLAVEVHQSSAANDDVSFAAELAGRPISPEIAVFEGTTLTAATERFDNVGTFNFGVAATGSSLGPQLFTLRNTGVGNLTGLSVSKAGAHPGDFTVARLTATTLPGNSTASFAVNFSPAFTGLRSAVLRIASSDSDEAIFEINVSATAYSAADLDGDGLLDAWEQAYWGTTAGHTATDDFDRDGLPELLELAFGRNPTAPDSQLQPTAVVEGGYLTITVTRHPGASYEVQSAGTLLSGQPASFNTTTTTLLLDNGTTLKVRDNIPFGTPPSRFMRVKVTGSP